MSQPAAATTTLIDCRDGMVEVMANDTAEWMLVTLWMAERARGWDGIDRELMKGLGEGESD